MKNILIVILSICLLISSGCTYFPQETTGSATAPSDSTTSESTTAETKGSSEDALIQQLPMVSVAVPTVTQSEAAEDGTVLFNYTFQNISLIVPDPEVADKVIVDFLNRIDQTAADAETIKAAAKTGYSSGSSWNPYLCQITYDPMRIDQGVLSMFGSYVTYQGTAHPDTSYVSVSYDLVTGDVLHLSDILTNSESGDTLCQLVVDALAAQENECYLYEGYEDTVKDRFSKNLNYDDSWYLSQNGLCFYFSPYEIAPYSSGVIVAEVSYSQLAGVMNDAYFPAELETATGAIEAEIFNEENLDQYNQFSEVVLEKDTQKVLLHTDKSVYNIRIEAGSWSSDGSEFTPEHIVFAACSLTPGDAIMVESQYANSLPSLRLSYTTNDQTVSYYLSLDVQTGIVTLVEI